MKNILLIAYYYPPLGGAGVQRTLKFAKYLHKFGYNVCVLTVDNSEGTIRDESLKYESLDGIKVFRAKEGEKNFLIKVANKIINRKTAVVQEVKSYDSSVSGNNNSIRNIIKKKMKTILLNLYRAMFIPDDKISWKKDAVRIGAEIIEKEEIDIVYSTSAPYTCHLIAYDLVKDTNLPWACDFRDPWASNPFVDYPWLIKKINEAMEKKIVQRANVVISVSQPIIDDFITGYKNEEISKFSVITNGYDEEDFENYSTNTSTESFVITYNGTLYGKRSPENFLKAVNKLIDGNKIDSSKLIIKFVGEIGRDAQQEITSFTAKFGDIIKCIKYLPHRESLKQIENSSALLLLIEGGKGSEGIFTGKIFEYIKSGKNIIGIVPDGVAKELIFETNTGFCCDPDKIDEIEEAIYKCYSIWKGDSKPLLVKEDKIKEYNRENLSKKLAGIMENACSKKRKS